MFDSHEDDKPVSDSSSPQPSQPPQGNAASVPFPSLQFAVEHQMEGLAILDPQGIFHYLNPAHARLYGYDPGELIGQSWKVLYDPEWQATIEQQHLPVLMASGSWRGEAVARRKDGTPFDHEISLSAIKDAQGGLTGFLCTCRDISDRKRIDRELHESQRRLAEAELAAKCGHWVWDVRRGLVSLSPGTRALYGVDPTTAEVPLEQIFSIVHPDDRARIRSLTEQAVRERRAVPAEFRVVHPDGTVRTLFGDGTATVDAAGALISLTGSLLDVTDRRHAEREARQQSQLLESFWKFAPACFVILDRNFNFIRVNDMYAKACGREVSDFPGHNHFEFYPSDAQAIFERVRATKTPFQILARPFVFPDHPEWGTTYWDWSLVPILDTTGEVELLVFSLSDVTERKRAEEALRDSEERLRRVLDALPVAAYTCDAEGLITYFNTRAAELWGREPRLNHPDDRFCGAFRLYLPDGSPVPHDRCWMVVTLTEKRAVTGKEVLIERPDGTRRSALAHINPLSDSSGRVIGAVNVLLDITERKQAEEVVSQSHRKYEDLVNTVNGIVWEVDVRTMAFTFVSRQAEEILGYPVEHWLTVPNFWVDHIHPEDRQWAPMFCLEETRKKSGHTFEYRMLAADGRTVWLRDIVSVMVEDDQPVMLRGVMVDITERKVMEEAERNRIVRRRMQEDALIELAKHRVIHEGDLEAAFRAITETAARLLGVGRASVWLLDADRSAIRLADLYQVEQNRHSSGTVLWARDFPAYFQAIASEARTVSAHEAHTDPRTREFSASYLAPLGIGAMLDAPIRLKGETGGVLCHEHLGGSRIWTSDEDSSAASLATMVSLALEAHERKQAEAALQESHERLQQALEASQTGTWRVDLRTMLDTRDASLNRMLGYPAQPSTQPVDDWFTHVHRDDMAEMRAAWEQALVTGLYDVEHRLVRRDGVVLWVHDRGRMVRDEAGRPLYAIGAATDITARKRLEEEAARAQYFINSILENIPHMIFVKESKNLRFASFNRAGEELVGFSREEVIGKSDYDLFPKEEADCFTRKDREVLAGGRLIDIPEEPIQTRSKGERLLRTKKIPILNEKGEPEYLLGISEDITERKQLEQRLRQAEKMEAIGTLAGGIAHDFNNILAAMIGYTELAMDGVAAGSLAKRNLEQVLVAGRRGKGLIQQILAFSRQREPQRDVIALDQLLREATTLLRASIPTTIEMRIDLQAAGSQVLADPTQLQQVIMNLCSNAAQAMREKGGTLGVCLEEVEVCQSVATAHPPLKPGPHIRLTIRDTGVGMTPEVLARIFDPFFTTKKVGEGTGLGLSAALGIVTSHRGTITVQSEQSRGSTFSVYLPKLVSVADPAAGSTIPVRGGSERILFVDDETMLAHLAEQMLGNLGYRVTAMTDPVLALGQFRNTPDAFDLVMTDHTMPGMNGEALTRELRRIRPDLPVILCTGYTQGFSEQTAQGLGISAFLVKPLEVAELDQAIRQALNPPLR